METHRAAAILASNKNYLAAIAQLRAIARVYPRMTVVQYQLGTLLGRVGRLEEARAAFDAAAVVEPDNPGGPIALASLLLRASQPEEALPYATLAAALADYHDSRSRASAYELAARVALALDDFSKRRACTPMRPSAPMQSYPCAASSTGGSSMRKAAMRRRSPLSKKQQRLSASTDTPLKTELHLVETLERLDRDQEAEDISV